MPGSYSTGYAFIMLAIVLISRVSPCCYCRTTPSYLASQSGLPWYSALGSESWCRCTCTSFLRLPRLFTKQFVRVKATEVILSGTGVLAEDKPHCSCYRYHYTSCTPAAMFKVDSCRCSISRSVTSATTITTSTTPPLAPLPPPTPTEAESDQVYTPSPKPSTPNPRPQTLKPSNPRQKQHSAFEGTALDICRTPAERHALVSVQPPNSNNVYLSKATLHR